MSRYWCFPFTFFENDKCILNLVPEISNILKGFFFFFFRFLLFQNFTCSLSDLWGAYSRYQ